MTAVVLAAGRSQRMGGCKALANVDGRPMLEHVLDAARGLTRVVVGSPAVCRWAADRRDLKLVCNDEPERGMMHSLALAHAAIDPAEPLAVLLADMPDVTAAHVSRIVRAYEPGIGVVVPMHGTRPGHPVIFGPQARRRIALLPPGDSLRVLRDAPDIRRREVPCEGNPPLDIDTPADLALRLARGTR